MGQDTIPVVTLKPKVNDGKYHIIKFVRSGADARLHVDWEYSSKTPVGKLFIIHRLLVFALYGTVK